MAVWLIDARGLSELLAGLGGGSLRRVRRRGTARQAAAPTDAAPPEHRFEPVEVPVAPLPVTPARRDGKRVPAAYTAVEGTYREVARAPMWRKAVSLVSLLGILVVVGVAIAALAGATFGALAEMVDSAVG